MPTSELPLRVGLVTGSGGLDHGLQQFLQHNGVRVVNDHSLDHLRPEHVESDDIDVLLVDLDDPLDEHLSRLDWLVGRSQVPILFNAARGAPSGERGRSLLSKLAHLARNPASVRRASVSRLPAVTKDVEKAAVPEKPKLRVVAPVTSGAPVPARRVWVLAGSLGGPQAVTRFLRALPADLPAGFVYAQHIGVDFLPVLARQLDRASELRVRPAADGEILAAGEVVVVPVGQRFLINDDGVMELRSVSRQTGHRPSIDSVMSELAQRFGARGGAIVFSGMGDDCARGVREIALWGGRVWAQDAASCQISTMPDSARRQGVVRFSGAPEQLAAELTKVIEIESGEDGPS